MKLKNILLASGLLVSASQLNAANAIVNGNFEAGLTGSHTAVISSELGSHRYGPTTYGSTMPTGWSRDGDRTWSASDINATDAFPAANGHYAMRLDANSAGGSNALSQSGISLIGGQMYTFSIDMWSEFTAGGADLDATLSSASFPGAIGLLNNYVDSVTGVERVSVNFTAAVTGDYTLTLQNANTIGPNSNDNHTWVDNVSIEAVPEPSSAALLGLGGLALILRRRK